VLVRRAHSICPGTGDVPRRLFKLHTRRRRFPRMEAVPRQVGGARRQIRSIGERPVRPGLVACDTAEGSLHDLGEGESRRRTGRRRPVLEHDESGDQGQLPDGSRGSGVRHLGLGRHPGKLPADRHLQHGCNLRLRAHAVCGRRSGTRQVQRSAGRQDRWSQCRPAVLRRLLRDTIFARQFV